MDASHVVSLSPEYLSFRSNIPARKIVLEDPEKVMFRIQYVKTFKISIFQDGRNYNVWQLILKIKWILHML